MKLKLLILTLATTLFFTACGSGETASIDTPSSTFTLDTNNYVAVAKRLYAQQDGKTTTTPLATKMLKAPNASRDKNTLYISKVQKPRGYKIENLEVLYNDKQLTVSVDSEFKYATVSYGGESTKVNFREFTTSN